MKTTLLTDGFGFKDTDYNGNHVKYGDKLESTIDGALVVTKEDAGYVIDDPNEVVDLDRVYTVKELIDNYRLTLKE